jgi:hypothetical protein
MAPTVAKEETAMNTITVKRRAKKEVVPENNIIKFLLGLVSTTGLRWRERDYGIMRETQEKHGQNRSPKRAKE